VGSIPTSGNKMLDEKNLAKLEKLNNDSVLEIVKKYAKLCKPKKVTVITDSDEDIDYVRKLALKNNEESPLKIQGHTIHFDGYHDQARDKENTRVLLPKGKDMTKFIKTIGRDEGLEEIFGLMDGIMKGKEMLVCFFCLGPRNSEFSIPGLQITDSPYVAHSETLLYRKGYEEFKRLKGSGDFFHFVHSAGRLEDGKSADVDKRRVYIDLEKSRVFSVNNQYAGNSVGLKKLAFRLAIKKSHGEGWLTEHMFIMGVHPKGKDRISYFTGAFPSACGKTSTAMLPGQTIVGDDIAYIKIKDGKAMAVNVEKGVFGIIKDVNPEDDPLIYKAITSPREVIFSNVLIDDEKPYWLGMGRDLPKNGLNYSGQWTEGETDGSGNKIFPAHKNARYTIKIKELENVDPKLEDVSGVEINGIIYGGRDSYTNVPVCQSFDWEHGVFMGACVESETTSATLGKEGVVKQNPMAILDFLVIPIGTYIKNYVEFGKRLDKVPLVFSMNYFLKGDDGKYLNKILDKKVWLLWMEGRAHGDFEAIETPIGFIPKYEDLKKLFKETMGKDYSKEEYEKQFLIRTNKLLERMERIKKFYKDEDMPEVFWEQFEKQKKRLINHKKAGVG
jgi:phosphoenolpyruvate carboxykinase (GTP)